MSTLALAFATFALGWLGICLATLRWAPRRSMVLLARIIRPTDHLGVTNNPTLGATVNVAAIALVATRFTVVGDAKLFIVIAPARAPGTSAAATSAVLAATLTVGSAASNRTPRSVLIKCRLRGSVVHHSGSRLNTSEIQHSWAVEVVVPPIFVCVGLGKDSVPRLGNIKG